MPRVAPLLIALQTARHALTDRVVLLARVLGSQPRPGHRLMAGNVFQLSRVGQWVGLRAPSCAVDLLPMPVCARRRTVPLSFVGEREEPTTGVVGAARDQTAGHGEVVDRQASAPLPGANAAVDRAEEHAAAAVPEDGDAAEPA